MPSQTNTRIVDARHAFHSGASESGNKYLAWDRWLNNTKVTLTSSRSDTGPVYGYRYKISHGLEATSSLTGTKQDLTISKGHIAFGTHIKNSSNPTWDWNFSYGNVTSSGAVGSGTVAALNVSVSNEAKRKFINKCIEAQSAFNGSTFLGELGDTLRGIRNPARALRSGIDDYMETCKRRRRGTKSQKRKILAETWLEYQYGWAPLISDINSASRQLERIRHGSPPYQWVEAIAQDSFDADMQVDDLGPGSLVILVNTLDKQTSIVKYYGMVNIDLPPGSYLSGRSLGFRWDQFVPTLWEIIPYSFLADYFTNIGDIIQSWSYAKSNLRWVSLTTVREHSIEKRTGASWSTASPSFLASRETEWIRKPGSSYASARIVSRTPAAGSLVPSLELSLPALGSLKWLNLAALAQSHRKLTPY
jgi:hypothetical protein